MRISGSSIRLRLIVGFGVIALLLAGTGAYFGLFVDRQREALETLRTQQEAFFALNRVANTFTDVQVALVQAESTREQIQSTWKAFQARLGAFREYDRDAAEKIGARVERYRREAEKLRLATTGTDARAIENATLSTRAEVIELAKILQGAFDGLDQRYKSVLQEQIDSQRAWENTFRVLTAIAIGLLLVYAVFLVRAIVTPLTATLRGIKAVRAGDVPSGMPHSGEFSEIGRVLEELGDATRLANQLAFTDSLTGLPSRGGFEQSLGIQLDDARAQRHKLVVAFIEIMQLPVVASAHGPSVANRCLSVVADKLTGLIGDGRGLARIGDTRFACYVRESSAANGDVLAWLRKLLDQLSEPVTVESLRLRLQPYIGFARFPADGEDVAALVAAAEAALSTARTRNNGQPASFDRAAVDRFRHDLVMAHEIERAIAQDELIPYFEPVVNLARGEVITVEALVRWNHPKRGLILPGNFIPLAERTGQIAAIDERTFDKACDQMARWYAAGQRFSLAFNVSPQVLSGNTVQRVLRVIENYQLPANRLVVELTETAIISSEQDTHSVIRELNSLGTVICLDDFGSGYSSLSYLLSLPITRLKVDRSFVAEIGRSATAERIIEATLLLSNQLGITVVAEGVETVEQMSWLARRRCIRQQGWLYARAQPAADFENWLNQAPQQIADIYEQMDAAA